MNQEMQTPAGNGRAYAAVKLVLCHPTDFRSSRQFLIPAHRLAVHRRRGGVAWER